MHYMQRRAYAYPTHLHALSHMRVKALLELSLLKLLLMELFSLWALICHQSASCFSLTLLPLPSSVSLQSYHDFPGDRVGIDLSKAHSCCTASQKQSP